MKSFLFLAMATFAVAFTSTTADAQLLDNAGFESALDATNNWGVFSQAAADPVLDTINPLTGAQHLSITFNGEGNDFAGIEQTELNIVTGEDYTFSLNALFDGDNLGVNAEFRIEWLDAGGAFVGGQFDSNVDITDLLTNDYQFFELTSTAPAGATQARAVVALQSFGSGQAGSTDDIGTVFFDDLNLSTTAIPEPTSLGLIALGLVGVVSRRRRR